MQKISFGIIVLNGEPFIKYNLENLYPHAYEILIVEGAVEKFKHAATPDGHSVDNTVEIIKTFPDPEGKIKLIQREGFWTEKDDMSNAYMERCTGDYIWQVDADEFYKTADIIKIKKLLHDNPEIVRADVKTINFWRSFGAVMQGASYVYGADEFRRVFRFKPGYRFVTHRPPTVGDEKGQLVDDENIISAKVLSEKFGIYMYHYSYVFDNGVMNKSNYYSQMGWGNGCEDGLRWAESCWKRFKNPLRIHLIKFPPSWLKPFAGQHPEIIKKMMVEISFREDESMVAFLMSEWRKYAELGNAITEYYRRAESGSMNKVKAAFSILRTLLFPTDLMALRADRTVFEVFAKTLFLNKEGQ